VPNDADVVEARNVRLDAPLALRSVTALGLGELVLNPRFHLGYSAPLFLMHLKRPCTLKLSRLPPQPGRSAVQSAPP